MIDLVVFDLDGTLVDSQRDIANAANRLIVELGGTRLTDDAVVGMVGEGAAVLVRRALTAAELDPATPRALERFLDLYSASALEHTVPYEGVKETLAEMHGTFAMSVLTNKPSAPADFILEGLDLRRWFRGVVGGDTGCGRKPDPAGLLHLVAAQGTTPARTLMVGDSPVDLAAARRAGTRICLARYGFGYRFDPADFAGDELFIDKPPDLIAALRAFP